MNELFSMFWWLLIGHAIADFALQSEAMARGKNPSHKSTPPSGAKLQICWYYWLLAHGLIHGAAVTLITGIPILGLLESLVHCTVDYGKCRQTYGIHLDQFLHLATKVCILVLWSCFKA